MSWMTSWWTIPIQDEVVDSFFELSVVDNLVGTSLSSAYNVALYGLSHYPAEEKEKKKEKKKVKKKEKKNENGVFENSINHY